MKALRILVLSLIALAALTILPGMASASQTLALRVLPRTPFLESADNGTLALNCDFELRNNGRVAYRINRIEMSVYDSSSELEYRRFVDTNGHDPGINTIPNLVVPAAGTLNVFNPFPNLPPWLHVHQLRFTFYFERWAKRKTYGRMDDAYPSITTRKLKSIFERASMAEPRTFAYLWPVRYGFLTATTTSPITGDFR